MSGLAIQAGMLRGSADETIYYRQGVLLDVNTLVAGDVIEYQINTSDSKFLVLNDEATSAAHFLLVIESGSGSSGVNTGNVFSFKIDGITQLNTSTRGQLHALIADGDTHTVEITLNNGIVNLNSIAFGDYTLFALDSGAVWDFKINGVLTVPYSVSASDYVPADSSNPTLDVMGELLTNPPITDGHNDAETLFDDLNVGVDDSTTPAILATGVAVVDYAFGDVVVNPRFKRELSPVGEDRHTLFNEVLAGECLDVATEYTT